MTDITGSGAAPRPTPLSESSAQVTRRKRKDLVLQGFGLAAILTAFAMLPS